MLSAVQHIFDFSNGQNDFMLLKADFRTGIIEQKRKQKKNCQKQTKQTMWQILDRGRDKDIKKSCAERIVM